MQIFAVFGILGGLRSCELKNLTVDHIETKGDMYLDKISDRKNNEPGLFAVEGEFKKIVDKYLNLRPSNCESKRLFINYRNGKCTKQAIGINKLSKMPSQIALFLGLPDPHLYTGLFRIQFRDYPYYYYYYYYYSLGLPILNPDLSGQTRASIAASSLAALSLTNVGYNSRSIHF